MSIQGSYKDLIVWQKSIVLVKRIYQLTSQLPVDERFGLVSQMRRAAVSIPSNIAEGHARRTTPDYVRFISNSQGSLAELETQLIICLELAYCEAGTSDDTISLMNEVRKMLNALRRSLMEKIDRKLDQGGDALAPFPLPLRLWNGSRHSVSR